MSLGLLYVLLGEVSGQVLCPFFNWIVYLPGLSHMSSLYILGTKALSDALFADVFSNTVGSLFILMVSLAVQKNFNLMSSQILKFFPLFTLL